MKPERIEEMRRNVEIVVAEAARNGDHKIEHWVKTADLLHLLRCARAWAELEAQIRSQGLGGSARLSAWARLSDAKVELDCGRFGYGPDLLTATEGALARAKDGGA